MSSVLLIALSCTTLNYLINLKQFLSQNCSDFFEIILLIDFDLDEELKLWLDTISNILLIQRCYVSLPSLQWKIGIDFLRLNNYEVRSAAFMILNERTTDRNLYNWIRRFRFVSVTDCNGFFNKEYSINEIPEIWMIRGNSLHALSVISFFYTQIKTIMLNKYIILEPIINVKKRTLPAQQFSVVASPNLKNIYQIVTTEGQWMVFEEIMKALKFVINKRGYKCFINFSGWLQGNNVLTICLGAHCYPPQWYLLLDKSCIIYNLEQLSDISPYNTAGYLSLMLRSNKIWEYNLSNQQWLKTKGISSVHVPIGYSPTYLYPPPVAPFTEESEKPIDVLFFGSMNDKRQNMLRRITLDNTINSCFGKPMFFAERAKFVQSSKIVLNLHYYEMARLEFSRLGPLLANGCFIISEVGCDKKDNEGFQSGIVFIHNADELYNKIKYYLAHPSEMKTIAEKGKQIYQSMPFEVPIQ